MLSTQVWGGSVRQFTSLRPLDRPGGDPAHQLPGDAGSMAGPSPLPTSPTGPPRLSPDGQHDGAILHKSPRGPLFNGAFSIWCVAS